MELESKRLRIRHFKPSDAAELFRLNSNPEVMRYIGETVKTEKECEDTIERVLNYYDENPGFGVYVAELKDSREFIGLCMLKSLEKSEHIEVGYRLHPEYWNKGYASEITACLLDYGFKTMHLKEIVGITDFGNIASQKVLMKNGLTFSHIANYYDTDVNFYVLGQEDYESKMNTSSI